MYLIGSLYSVVVKNKESYGAYLAPPESDDSPCKNTRKWLKNIYNINCIMLSKKAYGAAYLSLTFNVCLKILYQNRIYILVSPFIDKNLEDYIQITLLSK